MEDIFIKEILIQNVRNLAEQSLQLDEQQRKHLIITGKNGSGKTTLLEQIKTFLQSATKGNTPLIRYQQYQKEIEHQLTLIENDEVSGLDETAENLKKWLNRFGGTELVLNDISQFEKHLREGKFIVAYFDAKRGRQYKPPKGVTKLDIKPLYLLEDDAGKEFIQHIVNLRADKSFARDEGEMEIVAKIDDWFHLFQNNLRTLFDSPIELKFDRQHYDFQILEGKKEPYSLNQLSSGYSAILSIVTELIMRMELHKNKLYDLQGIVLIDEIETHLHIDLQKKVLPFLTALFPRIQFITTSHSPFILSSIENAIIYDLEKNFTTTDLSGYSYDTLIESYFSSDKYSDILKVKIIRYEQLLEQSDLSEQEQKELYKLKIYLDEIPKFISDELVVKLQQIKLKHLKKK